ncbi:lasso peptide biosynthesis PqqD family chaperone [Streptomyces sp. MST-110588]|uniref:lasso peptide biosynthesis PqqD family chaperone n=1 Tax=Streptomyces sp. MST-110588 TaxID=2833628 RepID=UPI001F5D3AD2|nr:lasso peptide biosynthesis PqqD family chaperone [Streptomyces sp. MST-110588]UNO38689.1 lasso peptide biosynthesis PqqD family chaperone [Streptomyces sp. MST-110588]
MTLKLRADVSTADTEYGTVLLDGSTGRYWQLNATASLALRTLLEGGTAEEAARRLTTGYDVEESRARADVEKLLAGLLAAKVAEA